MVDEFLSMSQKSQINFIQSYIIGDYTGTYLTGVVHYLWNELFDEKIKDPGPKPIKKFWEFYENWNGCKTSEKQDKVIKVLDDLADETNKIIEENPTKPNTGKLMVCYFKALLACGGRIPDLYKAYSNEIAEATKVYDGLGLSHEAF